MHLDNYGNRAWCRLEVYVFSCLVEIQSRPISCFAFGLHMPWLKTESEISEELMTTGKSGRGAASTFSGSFVNCFLKPSSKERLVPLFGHASGAAFATTYLPSSGDLTVEDDRDVVRAIEEIIQTAYSTFAIKIETDRLQSKSNGLSFTATASSSGNNKSSLSSSSSSRRLMAKTSSTLRSAKSILGVSQGGPVSMRDCMLNSKQIHDRDIAFLSKALSEISAGGQFIHTVNLRDNMITEIGVKTLLREYITVKDSAGGRRVRTLDLGGNPIGQGGAMLFERCLVGVAGGRCALDHLGLASTGLGPAGVLGLASWLRKAAQLVEVDLRGNGVFGAEAMEALIASMEEHGRVLIKVDDEAREGLTPEVVSRFEQASRNNVTAAGMDAM